ncbi:MAG: hypothetical protein ABIP54_02165 [Candidatus Andersenbacteria bacterium]
MNLPIVGGLPLNSGMLIEENQIKQAPEFLKIDILAMLTQIIGKNCLK